MGVVWTATLGSYWEAHTHRTRDTGRTELQSLKGQQAKSWSREASVISLKASESDQQKIWFNTKRLISFPHAHAHLSEVRKLAEVASVTSGPMRTALETAAGTSIWLPSFSAVGKPKKETDTLTTGLGWTKWTYSYSPSQTKLSKEPRFWTLLHPFSKQNIPCYSKGENANFRALMAGVGGVAKSWASTNVCSL